MNANSRQPAPIISSWLQNATNILAKVGISSPRLDAEIILAHTIHRPRTYLHAHGDTPLSAREHEVADARLRLRLDRVPVAYIIGHKDFYGRQFRVTPATLIPRPESETMIELLKDLARQTDAPTYTTLVDVGTGSGCLGITAKLELPALSVTLLDISKHALEIAKFNAKKYHVTASILQSDLLKQYPLPSDIILANLPYVDPAWTVSPETRHEPQRALFANKNGRDLIEKLIIQASDIQPPHGLLLIEADPQQHNALISLALQFAYRHIVTRGYIIALSKS